MTARARGSLAPISLFIGVLVVNETTKGNSDLFTFSPAVWLLAMKWYITPGMKAHVRGYYHWHLLIDNTR